MKSREMLYVESELAAQCGRKVHVTEPQADTLRIVLEPVEDRGRIELFAYVADNKWTVSDRGLSAEIYGDDLDFLVTKLGEFGTAVMRSGNELIADTREMSFIESVAQFVNNIEIIPVLAGLWSGDLAAA